MHPFQLGTDTAALVDEVRKKHMRDGDETWEGTHKRVARALFPDDAGLSGRLNDLLSSGRACPAGRILAGAGSGLDVTWWNCFVSPLLQDSMRTDDAKPGKGIMKTRKTIGNQTAFSACLPRAINIRPVITGICDPTSSSSSSCDRPST